MVVSGRGFASDNFAGVHPQVMEAVLRANVGHCPAYGDDAYTRSLEDVVKDNFGSAAHVFPVFNGTGGNVVALRALAQPWEAVVCTESAHINVDEGGAPENVAGLKLWQVPTTDGRMTAEQLESQAWGYGFVHRAQPRVLAVTQSTELGTVYDAESLARLVDHAHGHGMRVLVDGARLANAAASLDVSLARITADVGMDAVTFGGTKNGAMAAEAVIVFDDELAQAMAYLRKTYMQLASKMRFVSAQLVALLSDELWLRNAQQANSMAALLAQRVESLDGVRLTRTPEANAVFAVLPSPVTAALQSEFPFYVWDHESGEVRWMCAWDTEESDVEAFVAALQRALRAQR